MLRFLAGTLAACVCGALLAAAGQEPTFRAAQDIVRVFVTVTDRDGRLVTTLTRNDFDVRDEGKSQPITLFDNTPQPIRLIVMLDVSGSMAGNLPLLRTAAAQLFARLGPDDVARVGAFGHEITISPTFTRDAGELERALPRAIAQDAPTPLWRAIDQALNAMGSSGNPGNPGNNDNKRPVILVLSDGKDSGPVGLTSFRQRPVSQAEAIDRGRREDVMIYGVGMRSRPARPPVLDPGNLQAMLLADLPDPGLARVAEETGGGYAEIRLGQDLGAAFAQIIDELHTQYLLGFAPPRRDGKVHDVDVRVTPRGLEPRARKSYVAPK